MSLDPDVAFSGIAAGTRLGGGVVAPSLNDSFERAGPHHAMVTPACVLAKKAADARLAGEEAAAERCFREAIGVALQELDETTAKFPELPLLVAQWALECGEVAVARRLLVDQTETSGGNHTEIWAQIAEVAVWRDAWLIAAVRHDPPDAAALDVLVQRYWKALFGRCQMLTMKRETAADLAQDTWCRVLRGRERLRPGGNFRAYLLMIATNLWRDAQRVALRAGTLADHRLASLDHEVTRGDGPAVTLAEILPDMEQMEAAERERLKNDLDQALGQLEALSRDVLVARFLDGESCAEIGRRYGRTEQTANGWVRRALSELKLCLEDLRHGAQ